MNKLYDLLSDLVNIEYQFSCLLYVIDILESEYASSRKKELLLLVSLFEFYLSSMKLSTTNAADFLESVLLSMSKSPDSGPS